MDSWLESGGTTVEESWMEGGGRPLKDETKDVAAAEEGVRRDGGTPGRGSAWEKKRESTR